MFHFGPYKDDNILDGVDVDAVPLAEADFVLNTGPDDESPEGEAAWRGTLEAAAARHLPMICANPDIDVIRGTHRVICAGYVARVYEEEYGGSVRRIGKPDPVVYPPTLHMLGVEKSRVLALGDALATDLRGAHAAGIDAAWVLGGIHADLASQPAEAVHLAQRAGLAPRASLPGFIW